MVQIAKKTLPPGWRELTIAELALRIRGGDSQVTQTLVRDDGNIEIIFSSDLKNSKKTQSKKKVTENILRSTKNLAHKTVEEIHKEVFVPPQSVLLVIAGSNIGSVGMHLEGDAVINHAIVSITPDPTIIHPELLFYFFRNPRTRNLLLKTLRGSALLYLSLEDIKALHVKVPPLAQQDRIIQQAEALLSEAERTQALLQQNQKLMDQLLENIVHEVFTERQKGNWSTSTLSNLASLQENKTDLHQSQYIRYPFIAADDIDSAIFHIQIKQNRAEDTLPKRAKGTILDKDSDSLLYANTFLADTEWKSRVAMPYYKLESLPEKLRCKDDLFVLTARDISPRFLFWTLLHTNIPFSLTDNTQHQGKRRIKWERLKKLELSFPNPEEQKSISAYLDVTQEQVSQMKQSHIASQYIVDQLESSILDQIFWEE